MNTEEPKVGKDFIRQILDDDIKTNKHNGKVVTRFPPEPNGYLNIGHAKAICINFGIGEEYGGVTHLRFDDTNPTRENDEYVEAIKQDIKWLGWDWQDHLYFASDYFETLYEYAVKMLSKGLAFVCDLSADEIREYRGTLTEAGKNSPYRDRSVDENLDLFSRMRSGEFPDGSRVVRAKIDMAASNINLRDPVMYRILRAHHHRTGDKWCIYPTYDFTHGQSDSIEGITHSLCSLEFEDHRPLYDWYLDAIEIFHPQQIEFARLNLNYMVLSKRYHLELVRGGYVDGWDDPRMPTLSGLRRRGYTPKSIRVFCDKIGVAKRNSVVDYALLEHCVREDLNISAPRKMAVLKPLKVVITNYPEGEIEYMDAVNNPENPAEGTRKVPFSKELFIEQDDFREDPPRKYYRLSPGKEVRLRNAYFIKCEDFVKDKQTGEIIEVHCTYDPASRGGNSPDGRKVKATLHWVSAQHAISAEVRLYDRLFTLENPADVADGEDWKDGINPESREILSNCRLEPSLADMNAGYICQFERLGYFCVDEKDSREGHLVFNRTVTLRDAWARFQKKKQ